MANKFNSNKNAQFKKLSHRAREKGNNQFLKKEDNSVYTKFMKQFAETKWSQQIFEIAFECGGYIAGGMARMLLSPKSDFSKLAVQIKDSGTVTGALEQSKKIAYKSISDIDFFFRTESGFNEAVLKISQLKNNLEHDFENCSMLQSDKIHITTGTSVAGFAFNILYVGPENVDPSRGDRSVATNIQFIACNFGEPEEVCDRFDLMNSMVAFDKTHRWKAYGWKQLETNNTIEVSIWNPLTLWRINKYIRKYGYNSFSFRTQADMIDGISISLKQLFSSDLKPGEPGNPTKTDFVCALHKFICNSKHLKLDNNLIVYLVSVCNALANEGESALMSDIQHYVTNKSNGYHESQSVTFNNNVQMILEKFTDRCLKHEFEYT
jgi:hypothetical protein